MHYSKAMLLKVKILQIVALVNPAIEMGSILNFGSLKRKNSRRICFNFKKKLKTTLLYDPSQMAVLRVTLSRYRSCQH